MKNIICPRCSGHGKIEKYNHVESGICFECNGSGIKVVEDNVKDIIAEMREERKNVKEIEKQFNELWKQNKNDIKNNKDWNNYILCGGTETTTKDEERLIRINQYLEFKAEWKMYIKDHMELIDDLDKYKTIRMEFENRYLNSRE